MRTCPLLDEDGKVRVNFLGDTPIEYVIEEVPAEPIVKRYVDGSSIRQVLFIFVKHSRKYVFLLSIFILHHTTGL